MSINQNDNNPFINAFIKFIESETQEETKKITDKYKDLMSQDLERARERIVAQAGIKLSNYMTIQDMGQVLRIEIEKETK